MTVNPQRMIAQLILHEGLRLKAYQDSLGFWTVGVGYNLSARGTGILRKVVGKPFPAHIWKVTLTKDEALLVLCHDLETVEAAVIRVWPFYMTLGEIRKRVVLDMAFNLGHRAEQFVVARKAAERGDWVGVVTALYHSRWAHQVDDGEGGKFGRADRLTRMLLTQEDYTA